MGRPAAGVQELFGDKYPVNRTTETGSWLARRFQGHRIGTAMLQVLAALAFAYLDAAWTSRTPWRPVAQRGCEYCTMRISALPQ